MTELARSADPAEALVAVERFLTEFWDRLDSCAPGAPAEVHWQRDGLAVVASRLELLKQKDAALDSLATEFHRIRSMVTRYLRALRGREDDQLREGLQSRVTRLVGQGMAWEERRIAHETQVLDTAIWRRRFEDADAELRDVGDGLGVRMERVKSERFALQAQTRLINLGMEIGEI